MLEVMKELHKTNRKKEIDVIHALYPNSSVLSVLASKFIARLPSTVSLLYDIRSPWINMGVKRGDVSENLRQIAYFFEGFVLRRVDGVIFITRELEELYRKFISFQTFSRSHSIWG